METRERLYERIRRRIDVRPDRRVTKTYLAVVSVGRKLGAAPVGRSEI